MQAGTVLCSSAISLLVRDMRGLMNLEKNIFVSRSFLSDTGPERCKDGAHGNMAKL